MPALKSGHPNQQDFGAIDDVTLLPVAPSAAGGAMYSAGFVWDPIGLAWVKATQAGGGSGGGGAVTQSGVWSVGRTWTLASGTDSVAATIASLPLPAGAAQDGTDISTPTAMPAGGAGIRGWLSAIWTKLNGSLAVTGTFWQTTQPVSLATAPTTPVTGTFFQATQPVSLATAPLPTGAAQDGTDITTPTAMPAGGVGIRGWLSAIWTKLNGTVGVTGTFFQGTQPVSIATMPSTPVTGTFFQGTQPVSLATNTPDVTDRAARLLGVVTQAALTKGTQGANGVSTQDLKDSGRVAISFTAEFSPIAVTEALLSMSISKDGAAPTTATSYVPTSGKRLRIASMSLTVENTLGTSIQRAYLRQRFAVTAGVTATSPLQMTMGASAAGTVKSMGSNFDDIPDGFEYLGDGTKAIGWTLQAPDWVSATSTLKVYITILAFEY